VRPRLTVRANPELAGDTVILTARVPKEYAARLDAVVAQAPGGIATRTDAVQDALGVWLLLEENVLETNGTPSA
jgi:hypothetical protein